jgi:proline iminopeptidase
MPHPIPEPTDAGYTTSTSVPLYWVRYRATDPVSADSAPLVVLHGGPGADHRYLLPQMLHLAREHDLLLYDQRGGGQSRAPNNEPIGWRDHVADLASVCREFGIVTPTLVGYSWGAMLAMLYAMEAQGDAMLSAPARLALVSPAPVTAEYRQAFDANLRRRGSAPAIVAEREALVASGARERDPEGYRQRIFELGVAGYFADPAEARDLTPFRVVGRVQQSTWESLGDFDLRPGLEGVRVPSIVVAGRDDPIPTASSVDAARALRAELVLLDRCGHVPYVERPDELWAALDPFLGTFPV